MNEKYNNLIKQRDKAEKRLNKLISKGADCASQQETA